MKRILAVALSLVMALTLCVPALAAAPERPGWVKDWEYTVFEADDVYTGETWQIVERLRSDAAAGNLQPKKGDDRYEDWLAGEKTGAPAALRFELGLIGVQYTLNAGKRTAVAQARRYFGLAQDTYLDEGGTRDDATYNLLTLWYLRAGMVECSPGTNQTFSGLVLEEFLDRSSYTMEQFRDCPLMDLVTEADWATIQENLPAERAEAELAKTRAKVTLDGNRIDTENLARVVNGRTMIPVRCLAEQMGADVSYDSTLKAARIVRAGVEIIMPIGSKT